MFLKEGEYQNIDKRTRDSLNYSIADGLATTVYLTFITGVFLVGFALFLGATPFQIGLLSSIPFFANAAQIVGSYFIESTGQRKSITITSVLASRLLWIPIIIVSLFLFSSSMAIWIVIVIFAISSILGSMGGVSWLSWISSIVPRNILGKFFSRRNAYMGIIGVTIALLGGFFLDYWELNKPFGFSAFAVIFSVAVVFGLLSIYFLRKIHDIPDGREYITFSRFLYLVKTPFRDTTFRKFVRFGIMWGFAIGIWGPFAIVYMLQTLELSYMMIVALNTLFVVSGIITLGTWGKMVDRYGARPVLAICSLIVSFYPLWFILLTKWNFFILVPLNIITGIAWAGVDFATVQMLMRTAPQANKSVFFATFMSANGLAMAIAIIIGGAIAKIFSDVSYTMAFFTLSGLHFLFLITGILRLIGSTMIKNVEGPKAGGVNEVLAHLKETKIMNVFVNFYQIGDLSVNIVTLPFIYSKRVVKEGNQLFMKEMERFRTNSLNTLRQLEYLARATMNEILMGKYTDVRKLLPRLNMFEKKIEALEHKIVRIQDEKVEKTVALEVVKVEERAKKILGRLKKSEEKTRKPENYIERVIRLVRRIVK